MLDACFREGTKQQKFILIFALPIHLNKHCFIAMTSLKKHFFSSPIPLYPYTPVFLERHQNTNDTLNIGVIPSLVFRQIAPSSAQQAHHLLFLKDGLYDLVHLLLYLGLLQMKFRQAPSLLVYRP